jgi:hypothetical protein
MGKVTIGILCGAGGLAIGLVVGYVVVARACKDRVVGGVEAAAASAGASTTVQRLLGQITRGLVEASA